MDKAALQEYQRVLMNNTDIALLASERIKHYSQSAEPDSVALLWLFVHAFLVTVGNISKLLWPEKTSLKVTQFARDRGKQLRESLSIDDRDPTFFPIESKIVRNHFEHFDDRLDTWASTSKSRAVADMNPWGVIPDLSRIGDEVTLFRNFDVKNYSIIFGKETYPLTPVVEALHELYIRVREQWFSYFGIDPFPSNRSESRTSE